MSAPRAQLTGVETLTELSHTERRWIDFEDDLETRRERVTDVPQTQGVWG
jgi:hypothetical protein